MKSHKILSGLLAFSFPCILNASVILPEYQTKPTTDSAIQNKTVKLKPDSNCNRNPHHAIPRFNQPSN
jgi:hypothetical protein